MLVPVLVAATLLSAASINQLSAHFPATVDRSTSVAPDTLQRTPSAVDSVIFGELTDGATYRRVITRDGAIVHILTAQVGRGIVVEAVKARDSYDGLQTLTELYEHAEKHARATGDTVLAAINAGPWHPERLSPVGPLVVDGDVVELGSDDAWSSLLLYGTGGAAISRDRVTGQLLWRHRKLEIRSVNRRSNDGSIVLYNRLYGDVVPGIGTKSDRDIVADALESGLDEDTGIDYGDEEVDTAEIIRSYRASRSHDERERRSRKIAVRRLRTARADWFGEPRVNDTMWTLVTMVDTGMVPIPLDGYVISLGESEEWFYSARPGDTLKLLFQVARNGLGTVVGVVPGHPQLLFDGVQASEPEFAQGPAALVHAERRTARTAVGISGDAKTIMLVAVEPPTDGGDGGMTIDEVTALLRSLGADDAVALEGRSSTSMIVNYDVVTHRNGAPQRRISNALIVKKKRRW